MKLHNANKDDEMQMLLITFMFGLLVCFSPKRDVRPYQLQRSHSSFFSSPGTTFHCEIRLPVLTFKRGTNTSSIVC